MAYDQPELFSTWANLSVNDRIWRRIEKRVAALKERPPAQFKRALKIVRRVAAVETGAIEKLYEVDHGFTFTVAMSAAAWEGQRPETKDQRHELIEAQIDAYEWTVDFATRKLPLTTTLIRELHRSICTGQKTYVARTAGGEIEKPLPLGEYKEHPNHVVGTDGEVFYYAPPEITSQEMQRVADEFDTPEFDKAHPVIQIAFAHYGFVRVHPFADGNGRMARAIASIYTSRSVGVPLLILSAQRSAYLDSLRRCDRGDKQAFVDFILDCVERSIELGENSLKRSEFDDLPDLIRRVNSLYLTSGGYDQADVDTAGHNLLVLISKEVTSLFNDSRLGEKIEVTASLQNINYERLNSQTRPLIPGGRCVEVTVASVPPATAKATKQVRIAVPVDGDPDDEIVIYDDAQRDFRLQLRLRDLLPEVNESAKINARIFADSLLARTISEMVPNAERRLKEGGYKQT